MLPLDSWTKALTGISREMEMRLKQKIVKFGDKSNDKKEMQNQ